LNRKDQSQQRPLATSTAERIAVIIEAAERAAEGVIDDAEVQAARHLEEARAQANRIAAEHLREVADRLDPPGGSRPRAGGHLKPVEPPPSEEAGDRGYEPAAERPPRQRSNLAGARLLATQMAVSGSSRDEIAERLRTEFGIEDSTAILDAILGPEREE
jgi:hypothetical protein